MTELHFIYSFFARETLDTMSKNHKVAYKYCLGAIFINIIVGGKHIEGQKKTIELLMMSRAFQGRERISTE